jgi:DNA-binding transcriptional ArsR family regulator
MTERPEAYTTLVFVPSVDTGPYNSCAELAPIHGLHYPCERAAENADAERADAQAADIDAEQLALIYRALSDAQRLRILHLLHEGELYAQEIVERTGMHQSVVSRHLAFLKAVALVNVRRQNNMKFYSLNREMSAQLKQAVDAFLPPA